MNTIKAVSGILLTAILSGCSSVDGLSGPRGPRIVGSGHATETGNYAEIGVQFSSPGDFFALASPSRWKSPMRTGGSLSWLNPSAWSEDAGRTGRILAGQAVIVGGAVVAASAGGGGGSDSADVSSGGSGPANPSSPPAVPGGRPL